MATHTLIYLGNLDRDFTPTGDWPETYSPERKPVDPSGERVDGIKFGFMEKTPKTFFLVNVESLRLRAPVLLVPERHCDSKGFGPQASHFGDVSAAALLVDAIVANPEYRDHIAVHLRGLGNL